jgi:hypothetical protein
MNGVVMSGWAPVPVTGVHVPPLPFSSAGPLKVGLRSLHSLALKVGWNWGLSLTHAALESVENPNRATYCHYEKRYKLRTKK